MPEYVYGGGALPATKSDLIAVPGGADATKYLPAADVNTIMACIADIKAALLAGKYHGVIVQSSTPPTPPVGQVTLFVRASDQVLCAVLSDGTVVAVSSMTVDPAILSVLATGSTTSRTLGARFADILNVKDFGAVGNGSTDDTTAVQAAITAAVSTGQIVFLPQSTGAYIVTGLTASGSFGMLGPGTLKMKASTVGDILAISGTSAVARITGVVFDANEQNQAAQTVNRTINFTAIGTATAPAGLDVRSCTFVNGAYSDIRVSTDGDLATAEWVRIVNNTFLAGREGDTVAFAPRYVDLASPTDYVVEGNLFDRLSAPSAYGRAGVIAFDGPALGTEGRGSVTGNTFVRVGRSNLNSSLGAIDLYSRARSVVVSGNSITSPYGRGIDVKAESRAVAIVGNTIEGLSGGSDGTMSAQIVLNAAVVTEANGPFTISGNSMINSGNDGISITAKDSGGTLYSHGVLVGGNTITNAARRGIGIATASEISIVGNIVTGGAPSIYVDGVTTAIHITDNQITSSSNNGIQITAANTGAVLNVSKNTTTGGTRGIIIASGAGGEIHGNVIKGPSTSAVDIAGTTAALRITDNFSDASTPFVDSGTNTALHIQGNDWTMSATTHTIVIASDTINATMDWHYVDTEAAAATDNLSTINGGYDGQVLTLRPLSAARVVTIVDGTSLRTAGNFVMDDPQDSITLRWCNDAWIEIGRSNNNASGFSSPTIYKPPVLFTGRTADLAAQNMYASAPVGEYRVSVSARTTTSGTGTIATLNIIWTDEGGVKTLVVGTWALNSLTVTGQINATVFIHAAAATNIQYSVTGGTYGTSVYAISGLAERVN